MDGPSSPNDHTDSRVPVTIITGFLGAGKTTLLSKLVRSFSNKRIAIVQNEVSEEMGIESAVLTDSEGNIIPDFFELPNGCICCTAKGDLIQALENIISLGRERIDAIVVETTGVADPCTVVETLWVDSELCSSVVLDGVVAVVDCVNFASVLKEDHSLGHSDIGRRQVAVADRILLNKTDIASPSDITHTRELVAGLNPSAEVLTCCHSEVDGSWVLNIGSFGSNVRTFLDSIDASSRPHNHHDHSHQCESICTLSHHHEHLDSVDHVFLAFDRSSFDRALLESVIGDLLWSDDKPCGSIYRAKALILVDTEWYMLQAVGALFEIVPLPSANQLQGNRTDLVSKFLFVGSNLVKEEIRSRVLSAVSKES